MNMHRQIRLLYSSWRRLTRWEFWPMWALYPPIVLYILYLGVRYNSPTLFTIANPGMPHGGIAQMSKNQQFIAFGDNNPHLPRHCLIAKSCDTAERIELMEQFIHAHQLTFPIVLKPDFGERGKGVLVAKSMKQAKAYLAKVSIDTIVQEYAPGHEFGVFYARNPESEYGDILSITEKRSTHVTGNGRSTVEELILKDPRAILMAHTFLHVHASRLPYIPAIGETFTLCEIGTHSRGSLFLDATHLATEELRQSIDTLSRQLPGFNYGRYDLRVPSIEDFQKGISYKIVELNGVMSEPTHIYDPKHSYFYAIKTMGSYWKLAFRVASENRHIGYHPSSWRDLLMLARAHRSSS